MSAKFGQASSARSGVTRTAARPDVRRTQVELDELPEGTIVSDSRGHAWQKSRESWYRCFDGDGQSSWDIAPRMSEMRVLREGRGAA